jgi:uncharacterized membrane protein
MMNDGMMSGMGGWMILGTIIGVLVIILLVVAILKFMKK